MKLKSIIAILILVLIPISIAQIPKIKIFVTDKSNVITPETKALLEQDLRNLEKETNGLQFVIYIEPEYQKSFSLEEYTLKIAEQNGIGKKGNDNGVLLYVATGDREYRWEVGYGAESVLNAPLLGRISREYLLPNFKKGDYEKGIVEAADVVSRLVLNSDDADIRSLKAAQSTNSRLWIYVIFFILFIILSSFLNYRASKTGINKGINSRYYRAAGTGLFMGGFGRNFGRGGGGLGGFSGGGGGFGGGGFSGRF